MVCRVQEVVPKSWGCAGAEGCLGHCIVLACVMSADQAGVILSSVPRDTQMYMLAAAAP
jgi:hypothetical protein